MKLVRKVNNIVGAVVASVVSITLIAIAFIVLNYYGVFHTEPTVDIQPKNTYSKTLRVATDHDYRPFSYIKDGKYAGLDVELIAEVANRLGMNLELTLLDWEDAQTGLLDGTYDVILNMESNAILKTNKLIGTIPTDEKQYVVYGKEKIGHIGELYGMRVAAYNRFDELGMNVITGFSYQEMFEKVLNDELDYIICPIQVGDSFLEKLNARGTIVSSCQVSYMFGCMALKADDVELCSRLNEVIKTLQVEGFIDGLDNKWITRRYGSISAKEILENNPEVIVLLIIAVHVLIVGIVVIVFTSRDAKKNKAYAEELKKNIAIINQQNENLKIAEEKAQAASLAKTNFLFSMSHDIRTPMNAIIGFTNLAERHIGDVSKTKEYLSKISTSSNLLLGLINDILEMARIESGKAQLNLAPESIVEIMEQAEAVLRGQANDKNQELVFRIQADHPFVLCDKLKVNQFLMNLISNAIKYTGKNGHILVSLNEIESSGEDRAKYEIRVKDDGIGMSEEFQKKIFLPFEREQNSTVSKIVGTGLGMSIAKSIIELMGGEISLQSELGKGSEFTVTVEFGIAEDPGRLAETAAGPEEIITDGIKRRILVVDDNDINRIIATELLNDMGYETGEACDGQEAIGIIQKANDGDYDLILMDVQMPIVNGYEATKAIRNLNSPLASIPIIALTANAFEDDKKNAEKAGMNGHIAKPIDVELLKKTLKKIFEQKK